MKLTKQNLNDVSSLIFEGYLFCDVFISDMYITIKTLKTYEREKLSKKYKYSLTNSNLNLIIEILSYSILSVCGIEVSNEIIYKYLKNCQSKIILFLYNEYDKLEKRIDENSKFLDYYLESNESKYYWGIYKNTNTNIDFNSIKHVNQFQYYWIVVNSYREIMDEERRDWFKVEYMTNSICAFVNPKAYQKVKGKMDVTSRFDELDSKIEDRNQVLSRLEFVDEVEIQDEVKINEQGLVNADQDVFDQMKKRQGESKQEYSDRINELMKRQISGESTDDHDRIVREHEAILFKKLLMKKRVDVEVRKNVKNRKKLELETKAFIDDGILRESTSIIGNDEQVELIDEQVKEKGFYHNNVSYLDIVQEKAFASISQEKKEKYFKDVMEAEIDIDKATDVFLKSLYKDSNIGDQERPLEASSNESLYKSLDNNQDGLLQPQNESRTKKNDLIDKSNIQLAAEKASKMNINVEEKDLLKERKQKNKLKLDKVTHVLDRRNQALEIDDDVDQFII